MLWEASQQRRLREYDDILVLTHAAVREGMTDVYVALKRLRRKGKPARLIPDHKRHKPPTFDRLWADVDRLSTMYPERVVRRGADSADR